MSALPSLLRTLKNTAALGRKSIPDASDALVVLKLEKQFERLEKFYSSKPEKKKARVLRAKK